MARTPEVPVSAVVHNRDGTLDPDYARRYVAANTPTDPTTPDERTARFEATVAEVSGSKSGWNGVLDVMKMGVEKNNAGPGLHSGAADRFREAMAGAVRDGSWGDGQTKALVAAEVHHGADAYTAGAVSSYLEHLAGPNAEATRLTFARESIAAARGLEASHPDQSAHLYAQGAQALAGLPPATITSALEEMKSHDRDAVAKFAYGAVGGTASMQLAQKEDGVRTEHMPASGIGSVIKTLADEHAQTLMVDTVRGVSTYLTEKRGTPAEETLLANDAKTGLRAAMSSATSYEPGGHSNFDAVLRANREASGLSTDGMKLVSNVSRLELGASAHDGASHQFSDTMGNVMGHLAVDLARSSQTQAGGLEREFGKGAFGSGSPLTQEMTGARTLGNLVGQVREGLNEDFNEHSGMATAAQAGLSSMFTKMSSYAKDAALVPGPQAGPLKAFAGIVDGLKGEIPRDRTLTSSEAHQLVDKLESSVKDLLEKRPELQAEFKNGLSDSKTYASNLANEIAQKSSNKAADLEGGPIGRAIRDVVAPQAQEPPSPRAATAEELASALQSAVREHNAHLQPHAAQLREPQGAADVRPWKDANHRAGTVTGTLLEVNVNGREMYAIHTGRGQFATVDPVTDLHGITPTVPDRDGHAQPAVDHVVTLRTDGTVEAAPQQQHLQHAGAGR